MYLGHEKAKKIISKEHYQFTALMVINYKATAVAYIWSHLAAIFPKIRFKHKKKDIVKSLY